MLVKSLKNYQPTNLIVYIIFGIIFWFKTFINSKSPGIYFDSSPTPAYSLIFYLLSSPKLAILCKIIALSVILLQGLLVNGIINQYNLIGIRSYMPAMIFVFITANLPEYQILHPITFATLMLILAWNQLVRADYRENPLASYFNAAFLLGIATLIYPDYIYFVALFLISTFLNRIANPREAGMIISGILTVWYFYFSLFFIFTNKINLSGIDYDINLSFSEFQNLKSGQIFFFLYISVLIILASVQSSRSILNQKILFRRNLKLLFIWFLLAIMIFSFTSSSFELIYLAAIPISILLSLFFTTYTQRWVKEITFFILLAFTVINQFFPGLIP